MKRIAVVLAIACCLPAQADDDSQIARMCPDGCVVMTAQDFDKIKGEISAMRAVVRQLMAKQECI